MSDNNNEPRLITIAIHTYDRAVELQHTLQHRGIPVVLQNVNLTNPVVSSGVRVRIREADLPAALRIIENEDVFMRKATDCDKSAPVIIVPVDFTDYSLKIIEFAFKYASSVKADIMLLHSYINPALSKRVQLTDNLSFELTESQEVDKRLYADAKESLDHIAKKIYEDIQDAKLPPVKFSTRVQEGVPEDVIIELSKNENPLCVIMSTRGASRKEEELIGSVTAEVLDSSRVPVMSIPETVDIKSPDSIRNIAYFANFDQDDIIGIDILHRLFSNKSLNIIFIKRPSRRDREVSGSQIDNLLAYCRGHYNGFTFRCGDLMSISTEADYRNFMTSDKIDFIALPSKKRNIFSRFFNPSVAHRLLLKADAPVIVLPV